MTEDPKWPRAAHWLAQSSDQPELVLLGVPAHETSISHTNAYETPDAVRRALQRYSTYVVDADLDVRDLAVQDAGNVSEPDHFEGELRVAAAIKAVSPDALLFAVGGDNSITYSVMHARHDLETAGLITFDAHFDLRDGVSNGSPVRRLVDAGLNPKRIVQIGINDFSNSAEYAHRARAMGITVISRSQVAQRGIAAVVQEALRIAGADGADIYVDLDVDVCDRAFVPACPAAAPGGLTPSELRLVARMVGASPQVRTIDATEVDATCDAPDERTIRLVALLILESAAGRLASLRGK